MNRKISIIIALAIVASVSIGLLTGASGGGKGKAAEVRVAALKKQDLDQYVSATGTVYSTRSTEVYSSMNYTVKTVNVQVGDRVQEGDVLAVLDMDSLEMDIKQKQAAISASQSSANQSLASAQSDLEAYKRNFENGSDTNLVNAQAAITAAEMDVDTAVMDVAAAERDIATADLDVETAEIEMHAANIEVATARRELKDAREGYIDFDDYAEYEYDAVVNPLIDKLRAREAALEKAEVNLEKVKANREKVKANLDKVKANLDKAVANLEKALENYEALRVSGSDNVVAYSNKVKSAQIATNYDDQYIALQKLQDDLGKSAILAPAPGTVTEVVAVEGGSGSGLLFVIQETDKLKVISNVKEYDIDVISIGDKVNIKSDATGDKVFTGRLSKIAPTSTLTAKGSTQDSTTAEYECEVEVSSSEVGLKIGMNTRLSIITQQKKGVYAVPYESVITNEAGETVLFVASPQEDGSYIAKEVPVTTGMETDLRVEISAETLAEGDLIIKSAEGVLAGAPVIPQES